MLPNFLIIGAPKAATTWIADGLREHRDVFIPQIKELRFFCGQNLDQGLSWYERHYLEVNGESAVGDASPSYLGSPEAPERIARLLPDSRLILSLRHPVEQAFSFYWHLLSRGSIGIDTDFRAFFEENRPRAGYYGRNLSRYLAKFDRDQLLILRYEEDVQANPRRGIAKCFAFLGVDQDFAPSGLTTKSNEKRHLGTFHASAGVARKWVSALPYGLGRPLKRVGKRLLNQFPIRQHAPVLDGTIRRQLLMEHYRDDIRQLERLTGQDFSAWYEG